MWGPLLILMGTSPYDTWGGLLIAPVLIVVYRCRRSGRQATRRVTPVSSTVAVLGHSLAKLLGGVARFVLAYVIYDSKGDAFKYSQDAVARSRSVGDGTRGSRGHDRDAGELHHLGDCVIHTLLRPSILAGFLVFSWLGFWGLFWFYRSFQLAVPEGRPRTYAKLLFFLPSLVYWPSSIGKEAWMIFCWV